MGRVSAQVGLRFENHLLDLVQQANVLRFMVNQNAGCEDILFCSFASVSDLLHSLPDISAPVPLCVGHCFLLLRPSESLSADEILPTVPFPAALPENRAD